MNPPTNGWGKPVLSSGTTVGDDVERIRVLRNEVYGHISNTADAGKISSQFWSDVKDICSRMTALLPSKSYCVDLNTIQTCSMDSDLGKTLF